MRVVKPDELTRGTYRRGGSSRVVFPPVPAFYSLPKTLDDIIDHTVGRVLDHFGIEHDLVRRWGESPSLDSDDA